MTLKLTNPKEIVAVGKLPLWLCSTVAKAQWALCQYAGLIKYGAWNWRAAGVRASTYISAMERHLEKWKGGQEFDYDDGTHHLGNIMACAAILLDAQAAGKLNDDRPPATVDIDAVFDKLNLQLEVLREKYKDRNPRHFNIDDTAEIKNDN